VNNLTNNLNCSVCFWWNRYQIAILTSQGLTPAPQFCSLTYLPLPGSRLMCLRPRTSYREMRDSVSENSQVKCVTVGWFVFCQVASKQLWLSSCPLSIDLFPIESFRGGSKPDWPPRTMTVSRFARKQMLSEAHILHTRPALLWWL
jgi:hypothetical protein